MKTRIANIILFATVGTLLAACGGNGQDSHDHDHGHDHGNGDHENQVHLSLQQFDALEVTVDSLPKRNLSSYVEANGQLEVPPQNEAEVTAIIGANVQSIKVIEGENVKKGQVLAYIAHPNIIEMQTDYIENWNQLQYLEQEYERQEKLYGEQVGSGKKFQEIKADYNAKKGIVKGLESKLNLLGIDVKRLQENEIIEQVAVRSPITGSVQLVEVKVGQYVAPETAMFEIVNVDHIHADLMVFEKDVHKIREGQKVTFTVESLPGNELQAEIYSVGKSFEQDPKAVHVHAEIENKEGFLIPGMYVRGRIMVDDMENYALPEEGLVREGEKYFVFSATQEVHNEDTNWVFKPIEVVAGVRDGGWVEIKFVELPEAGTMFAWNNAYNLIAELKKEEAEHSH